MGKKKGKRALQRRAAQSKGRRAAGVYIAPDEPRVTMIVLEDQGDVVAARQWFLDRETGLLVHCRCGNDECPFMHQEIMPAPPGEIESQLGQEIRNFARELGVPGCRISYGTGDPDNPESLPQLTLGPQWRDPETVGLARAAWLAREGIRRRMEG